MLSNHPLKKEKQPISRFNSNGCRILVVEDEAIIAMDIQSILRKMGYVHSEVVYSGEESVQKAASGKPHLVLMDIKLKGTMDGIQAGRQIFYVYKIPVIYITAFGDEGTLKRANGTARFGYITKPFEEHELQAAVENALLKAYN
ncbi:MAG: response regulator [Acidobacteriota bacterium]